MNKIILFLILLPSISLAGSMNMLGEKGNPSDVSKVIVVNSPVARVGDSADAGAMTSGSGKVIIGG